MPTAQPEIFFSYAWGGEKETYALALYDALQAAGHKVIMDRHEVQYRENFTQFMQRIGRGAFIIVVISDKYLRSPFCMFELLEIYRKSNSELPEMTAKVFPVVIGDANIYDDAGILQYTKYWRQKTTDMRNGMTDDMDLVDTVDFGTKLKRYNEIANNMANFGLWLQNTNIPKPEVLAANNYERIITAIANHWQQVQAQQASDGLPRHLLTPPFLSDLFLGRQTELDTIRQKLFAGDNMLLLVNGTGGVGKTSLAARFYHTYSHEYAHLAWVLSEKSIANALLLLAAPLGLRFDIQTREEQLELLLTRMANLPRPCLLVIDNANELDDLEAHYAALRRCPNFHLLLTTRITAFAKATVCPVGALPYPQALQLFTEYYSEHDAADDALFEQVYNAVEGNTLIIELLAKNLQVLQDTHADYGLPQMVADLQKGVLQITQTKAVDSTYHTPKLSKGDPLDIIAAMYDIGELAPAEKRLLGILSVLPAESIPFYILQTLLPATENLGDNLHSLSRKGWIAQDRQAAAYKISPVVQEITRAKNTDLLGDCRELIGKLIEGMDYEGEHLTSESYNKAPLCARFGEALTSCFSTVDNNLAILYDRMGSYSAITGNLPRALQLYQNYHNMRHQLCAAYPDNVGFKNGLAISYEKLGQTYADMGNLPKALQFYEQQSLLAKQLFDDYPDNVGFKNGLAISYSKLGETYAAMGNLPKALQFYELRSQLGKQLFDDYPDNVGFKNGLAVSYSKLGETYASMGNLPKALQFYEQQSLLAKQLFDDYPDNVGFKNGLAISYEKLGQTYASMGNLPKALQFYEQQSLLAKQLFDDYPDNVGFKNGLAVSYAKLGDFYKDTDTAKARTQFEAAEKLWVELVAAAPQYAQFGQYLDFVRSRLAEL